MNGHVELKRSCRVRKSQFEHLNQSLLFDQLVNSTTEAVLQEMDNMSSIRQSREENMDMYSRVKRRKSVRRSTYNLQTHHNGMSKSEQEEEETEDEVGAGEENDRPYNLRKRKAVQRYEAPPIEPVNKKQRAQSLFDIHRSPARRSHIRVKQHAIHSSDTTSSSDEERFERRKSKSMSRARNRCLPMNLTAEDLASGVLRDRVKVGASLADVDPMNLDNTVKFDSVGGLNNHIQSLKEMVVFPLLYPEIFEKFKIQPPRGCLFYGPPGTGKTLVARALANECSQGEKKVSFFMRKGADCLSKWVGESERQLRLLFDQAYLMRPSIIFFDEIDGLAPVRSSRQDQIHSSIVSTLLALMDGLDSRGQIVVIGATNRLDSIDPALRRPGRFDREFLFNLPDKNARKHIFEIHTRDWNPKLAEPFVEELSEKCVGYCGADIKALCTEAALAALRRRYPQVYSSSVKLKLDITSIVLGPGDFSKAMGTIVPASQRALAPPGQALSPKLRPLLANSFSLVQKALQRVFPLAQCNDNTHGRTLLSWSLLLFFPTAYRPRLLLAGAPGSGQSSHLAPALLHHLDKLPVHRLDLPTLYSNSAKTPEESCAQVFREARRSAPSVVYIPHISEWWDTVSDTVKSTFLTLLQDLPSFCPVLILATAETHYARLSEEVRCMFQCIYGEVITVSAPGEEDMRSFFSELLLVQAVKPPPRLRNPVALRVLELLPVAEAPAPRALSAEEQRRLAEQEENTLRELRLFLRDVTKRLATDKRFNIFSKPVDIDEVSDYLEVIRQPMDLSTVMTKIDTYQYLTVKDFLTDIDLICSNALEYNPDKEPADKVIRHRACSLKDTAHAIFSSELDPEFDRMCEEIKETCKKRVFFFSPLIDYVKRKVRRKPYWVRGIIRKKKYYKKETEEEEEEAEPEVEAAAMNDSFLTQDEESSWDTTDPQLNGHHPHALSTEEESSNEPPVVTCAKLGDAGEAREQSKPKVAESKSMKEHNAPLCVDGSSPPSKKVGSKLELADCQPLSETSKPTESHPVSQVDCVNGNESMDSLDLPSLSSSDERSTAQNVTEDLKRPQQDIVVQDQVDEGMDHHFVKIIVFILDVLVCFVSLQALLDQVVNKSEGYSVEQLERLYSVLSQCIYQHRREYNKTQLLEVSPTHRFHTH
uniref:ATPase family AAA domain-containing protein 2 n=1 Tax=Gouania willdenowi TaxID=441366 RepID=A0A8C5I4G4_GOUWI